MAWAFPVRGLTVTKTWIKGDRVVHSTKPEWGHGQVVLAEPVAIDGRVVQRLTIRFDRAGTKTVSTEYADLVPAADQPKIAEDAPDKRDALSTAADTATVQAAMMRLPDRATDPFLPFKSRLQHSLDLYRYEESPSKLMDWAAMQTGLKDPLARFNRHELEHWFLKFRIAADDHLKKLLRDMRRQEPGTIDPVVSAAGPLAKQALRRVDMGR